VPQDDEISAFDAATAVRRAEGGGLIADLDPGWDVGGGVMNGGYLLSVVARAAVLESPHPHPVALSASYLRATGPGRVALEVMPGSAGRTLAHAQVVLADAGGPCLTVQTTTAALGSGEVTWSTPPPEIAPVEECLSAAEQAAGEVDVPDVGIRHRVETRLDPATAGWVAGRPSGEPVMRAWVRFADGRGPDPFGLITFADALPPTLWSMGRIGWAPTVQLQVLLRALPAPGWCLAEARAGEVADGWFDEDYKIWDSTGRLVAQSRQLARAPRG
jgi:acyl-coenzyme A thioesterase PaaI-like protein